VIRKTTKKAALKKQPSRQRKEAMKKLHLFGIGRNTYIAVHERLGQNLFADIACAFTASMNDCLVQMKRE